MEVLVYGTRGSTPGQPRGSTIYGGHTTCLRIKSGCLPQGMALAIDAGSGFVDLSKDALKEGIIYMQVTRGAADRAFNFPKGEVKPTLIAFTQAMNLVNNPKVTIDRITGGISIKGFGNGFSGECRKFDPETMTKKF